MNAEVYRYPLQILEKDLDFYGHVNNATYLVFYEQARWDYITKNGYGVHKIRETGKGPVILEIDIKFIRELKLREEVVIETKLISYEKKIAKMEQWIRRGDEICSTVLITFGLFDLKERKLISPTPEWAKAIGMKLDEA